MFPCVTEGKETAASAKLQGYTLLMKTVQSMGPDRLSREAGKRGTGGKGRDMP